MTLVGWCITQENYPFSSLPRSRSQDDDDTGLVGFCPGISLPQMGHGSQLREVLHFLVETNWLAARILQTNSELME